MAEKQNWSQVRHLTDSGQMNDKVDFPDPSVAPLGTDEEAGGARTPEEDIAAAERRRQTHVNPVIDTRRGRRSTQLLIAVLAGTAALIALLALM